MEISKQCGVGCSGGEMKDKEYKETGAQRGEAVILDGVTARL